MDTNEAEIKRAMTEMLEAAYLKSPWTPGTNALEWEKTFHRHYQTEVMLRAAKGTLPHQDLGSEKMQQLLKRCAEDLLVEKIIEQLAELDKILDARSEQTKRKSPETPVLH